MQGVTSEIAINARRAGAEMRKEWACDPASMQGAAGNRGMVHESRATAWAPGAARVAEGDESPAPHCAAVTAPARSAATSFCTAAKVFLPTDSATAFMPCIALAA